MGAKASKDERLYKEVKGGNVESMKALLRDGAGLEWIDKEGQTPLILACMRPKLLQVVEVLIDWGANVNARSRGSYVGTPLHFAAYNGFVKAVELLLANGAKPLPDSNKQTPLDLAREKKYYHVVRVIESRICLFDGWLRELQRPRNLEGIVQQCLYNKIWAVILPSNLHDRTTHPKYKLAIYFDQQAAQPKCVILLWKVQIEEPDFNQPDPALVIVDKTTKKRYEFLSENKGDEQQLRLLCNACKGIPQRNTDLPPLSSPHANQPRPSAPPMVEETFNAGSSIDSSPVDLPIPTREFQRRTNVANEGGSTGSCVICLDAPREYACDPCGHKAACKRCSEEIKAKRECPCCRKKIDKVIKIFDP